MSVFIEDHIRGKKKKYCKKNPQKERTIKVIKNKGEGNYRSLKWKQKRKSEVF